MLPTVSTLLTSFLLACRADGLSDRSLEWYRYALKGFVHRFPDQPFEEIDAQACRQYIAALRTQQSRYLGAAQRPEEPGSLSPETIRGRIRALHRFFTWAYQEYNLEPKQNPMSKIKMPRAPRALPKAIDLADLKRLIEACGDDLEGIRNRAILYFLTDTGCRAGGLLSLRPADLELERGRAILREKGDRVRVVPFTRVTAEIVRSWMAVRPPEAETVFCSLGGFEASVWRGEPMTLSGLNQMLKRLKARAGIAGRVNPHSFRHGFARAYLRNGGDLSTLKDLMGHSSITVTTMYLVFDDDRLAEQHERFSPTKDL